LLVETPDLVIYIWRVDKGSIELQEWGIWISEVAATKKLELGFVAAFLRYI
jgi:hypothetical protein